MSKQATSAGVVKEVIANLKPGEYVGIAVLYAAVKAAGIDKLEVQVLADVQSLASRRVIGRGPEKQTYCQLEDGVATSVRKSEDGAPAEPRARKLKAGGRAIPNQDVLDGLEQAIGPAVSRNKDEDGFCSVLLGEWDHQFLLDRAAMVLKTKPSRWFSFRVGENLAVGFYR